MLIAFLFSALLEIYVMQKKIVFNCALTYPPSSYYSCSLVPLSLTANAQLYLFCGSVDVFKTEKRFTDFACALFFSSSSVKYQIAFFNTLLLLFILL